jgi:uncharacterized protein with FMN-binding domain
MHASRPLAALALTAAGSALVIGFQVPPTTESSSLAKELGATTTDSGATTNESGATTTTTTDLGSTSAAVAASQYADGTYQGAAVDEPWGVFQVQAVVSGGQLVDVAIVAAPTDSHSSRINSRSIPTLTSQALTTQSADVDVISGATWTSESYATSLQAALDSAEAALDAAA